MKDYKALQNGSDIRGVAMAVPGGKPVNLTDEAVMDLARGFAEWLRAKYPDKDPGSFSVAVGRDSRVTGEFLQAVFCAAMSAQGVSVLNCGMATTPAMFMATVNDEISPEGAVMITASHLPSERNGLKFFTREGGLDKKDISEIIKIAETEPTTGFFCAPGDPNCCGPNALPFGEIYDYDLMKFYSIHLKRIICRGLGAEPAIDKKTGAEVFGKPLAGLKIVVDAGNGAGGFYVSDVLEPLGADCTGSQFLDPDGTFPNHVPNPENKEAMESICAAVKANKADLGIIFDTDVDRSAAVDEHGREIGRNRIVALAAALASEGHPSTTIVTDSITSTQLAVFLTEELGLKHLRFKRGYKNVINKGLELNAAGTDCQLAIETSGHAAMKENWFLDDGAYLATRIVVKAAQLKARGLGISSILEKLEDPLEAKEYRFAIKAEDFADYAQTVLDRVRGAVEKGELPGASLELPNYEGVRVNFDKDHGDGWLLIRKSLHDPVMPMNVESNIPGGVEKIYSQLLPVLKEFAQLVL